MSKSECDDLEWSVIDDSESPINPAGSPSCIDSDFEDLATPQIEGEQAAECVEEKSSAEPVQFALPLAVPVVVQQPIAVAAAEVKQNNVQVEIPPTSDTQSPSSVPSVSIHTESVALSPQTESVEASQAMSVSDTPSSPESSVLDPSPCSPSMNAVLEFPSSAPQSESEPEDDEKHFDLDQGEETGEVEESSFLTLQCPMCSRHSTSEKQCSFCCFQLQWDCPRCTYLNSFADDACLMCSLNAEPNQPPTHSTAPTHTHTHTRPSISEPTYAEADDADESADFDDVSFFKDSDRRRCATDASVKRQKDRVAVKVSIPLQFNLLNQSARVLNEEAARKREVQVVKEFNVEDIVRIRSLLRFKPSNAATASAKHGPARTADNTDLNCDEEYSEHVRSVVSRRNAKSRAAKSKRSQAKLNSHDKRKARSDARKSLSQPFDWEDLGTFRQQCADRHATELLNGTLASRTYWRSNEDVMELQSIRTIPLPDNLIDRFFNQCKSVSGKKSKYVLSLCMQRVSFVHPSLRERLSLVDTENAGNLVVFAVISHPGCFYYPPAECELPLFEVSYAYRYTEKVALPSVTSDQIANRTTLAKLHKMADRLRSKAFFEADLVRHSHEVPLSVE